MTSRGIVYIDGDEDGLYANFAAPPNWVVHRAEHAGLSAAMNWCLATYPDEASYGWLADDMRPRTRRWDTKLEAEAGSIMLAQADDAWAYLRDPRSVRSGQEPSAGQCWGGDLLRAVGWWGLPKTFQGGTDVAWCNLTAPLGLSRFVDYVLVEHLHWRNGKRQRDELDTDMHDSNNHLHTQNDITVLYNWLASHDFQKTVARIKAVMP